MDSRREITEGRTPVKYYHSKRFSCAFAIWIFAMVVLGMSAAVVARTSISPIRSAAIFNLSAGALQFFILLFFTGTRPVSATDARPLKRATYALVFTTLVWLAAFIVMFTFRSYDSIYDALNSRKRGIFSLGVGIVVGLENLTIGIGVFGICAFVSCLVQWYYEIMLIKGKYDMEDIAVAYHWDDKTARQA